MHAMGQRVKQKEEIDDLENAVSRLQMRVQSLELMRVEMKETPKISLKQKNEFCESLVN